MTSLDASPLGETTSRISLTPLLSADELRSYSKVSNGRFLFAVARQWLVVGAVTAAAWASQSWLVYLFAMCVIATRQHALGILMHDATHFRCLTSRAANDIVTDLFCALPINMLTSRYRYEHQLHHRFLNTDDDPYWLDFKSMHAWHWPKKKKEALRLFAFDLLALNSLAIGKAVFRWSPWFCHFSRQGPLRLTGVERVTTYGFFALLVVVLSITNMWFEFFVLWIVPMMTLTTALIRIRTVAEHLALPNQHSLNASRHVEGTLLERLSIAPLNINYHIDHHLFPSVPYYRLPALHYRLTRDATYMQYAHTRKTYLVGPDSVWNEITT